MLMSRLICPPKFRFARRGLSTQGLRILDIGCGNGSPTLTKRWFPDCHYSGADIQQYSNTDADLAAIDVFYPLGMNGSGYDAIPDNSFDFVILNHVVEHMPAPLPILTSICSKLKPGGRIWIAFPSIRSLSLPQAKGCLQFCDDDSHIYVPDVREISNILLANGVKILHAGRSRDTLRALLGALRLPWALLNRLFTGKLSGGLWYLLGFEDHVFGQRRPSSNESN